MTVMLYLLLTSLILGGAALGIFLWSLRSGQYDDLEGAASRILFDETNPGDAGDPQNAARKRRQLSGPP